MKFFADGPSIPDLLLERCDAGRVVFLCGAGVSIPSGMPSFIDLTKHVVDFFDPAPDSEIMTSFQPWLDDPSAANMPLDQIFNLLHQEYGRNEVNALVTERLCAPNMAKRIGYEHGLIKRISSRQSGIPQLVTTNFDLLFEAGDSAKLAVHAPPAFPDLSLGASLDGITYLHGRLAGADAEQHSYVLSSADFGRAYLSEAWATNFIRTLLEHFTVVLLGYQAEDPPVKYLLQGLNHDGQSDRSRLYAFDKGRAEDIEVKWRDRGVTAIAYEDHPHLWQTLEAWANRVDDPRAWRANVISSTQYDPKDFAPHQREQVTHVLSSVQGAKLFSQADPVPHPEWICVLDGFIRSSKGSRSDFEDEAVFSPHQAYGLDDDLVDIPEADSRKGVRNKNLLEWQQGDESPVDCHRLGGRPVEGYENLPRRLGHLMTWIGKSIHSPVIAWWAIRQNGLHPALIANIDRSLNHDVTLDAKARDVWRLILEHHSDPRNRKYDVEWFGLKERISKEGWTASVLRDFHRAFHPRLEISPLPRFSLPLKEWTETSIGQICQLELKLLDLHGEGLDVPDTVLPHVLKILEGHFNEASSILSDLGQPYFIIPTCYPSREVDGHERDPEEAEVLHLFVKLYDRMVVINPALAHSHAVSWDHHEKYFFRKFKLYALSKVEVFTAEDVVEALMSLDVSAFWDWEVSCELLFLIEDRWPTFSDADRHRVIEHILAGPEQGIYWPDEYPAFRNKMVARYGRYLELKGCVLSETHSELLEKIIVTIPEWDDSWALSTVTRGETYSGWVNTDESPSSIIDLPVNEIVNKAKEELQQDFASFTERRSFTGLAKVNPRKALSALTIVGKAGEYPTAFWSVLIDEMPKDISPRLMRVYLHRLNRLPFPVVIELRHTIGRWLEHNLKAVLELDEALGWSLYDHIVNGILTGGEGAAKSGLGEIRRRGEILQRSRQTLGHAINGPVGMCAEALIQVISDEGHQLPLSIKSRMVRLFLVTGEGGAHAIAICMRQLNWLMQVDPLWTETCLIPMLAFDHPASEPAWNGFFHSQRVPSRQLAPIVKPLLLEIYPRVETFSWDGNLSVLPAQWLGWMCIFASGEVHGITQKEMRNALRKMSDGTRNQFISWLGRVGQSNDDGWLKLVAPFIDQVWPRERVFRTSTTSSSWIQLLDDTGDDFPIVYAAVKRFLVPLESDGHPFYRFTRKMNDKEPIALQHPDTTLDLIDIVTPKSPTRLPYQLPEILAVITEANQKLVTDPRYLRLIDLVG